MVSWEQTFFASMTCSFCHKRTLHTLSWTRDTTFYCLLQRLCFCFYLCCLCLFFHFYICYILISILLVFFDDLFIVIVHCVSFLHFNAIHSHSSSLSLNLFVRSSFTFLFPSQFSAIHSFSIVHLSN